jgi:two-component system sensor histidine kinase MprB
VNLRSRMGVAGALVVACTLGVIAPVLYRAQAAIVAEQFDASLASTAQQTTQPEFSLVVKQSTASGGAGGSSPHQFGGALVQSTSIPAIGGGGTGLPTFDAHDIAVFDGSAPSFTANIDYRGTVYRMYTTRIAFSEPAPAPGLDERTGYSLVRVARKLSDETAPLHRLAILMITLACGGALAAMLVTTLLTGRILRPARRLTVAVEHVTATGDLTADLGLDGGHRRGRDELGRLAASFTVMMRALDDSLQAQRRLVADASHELRTPLTSLTTNLDLLDEISGSPDPLTPELVRDARTQAHELRTLVNDLIDLARYTGVETHTEDTRLDLLTQQAVKRTQDLATARTRELSFEPHLEECLVLVDPDAVHRAITNLLDNAVKWSPDGGTIRVELHTTDDGHAELGVRDQGPGIPPDDLPFVFDRFYRSPTARALPGSGLGLAIGRQNAGSWPRVSRPPDIDRTCHAVLGEPAVPCARHVHAGVAHRGDPGAGRRTAERAGTQTVSSALPRGAAHLGLRRLPGRPGRLRRQLPALGTAQRQPRGSTRLRLRAIPQRPQRLGHTLNELVRRRTRTPTWERGRPRPTARTRPARRWPTAPIQPGRARRWPRARIRPGRPRPTAAIQPGRARRWPTAGTRPEQPRPTAPIQPGGVQPTSHHRPVPVPPTSARERRWPTGRGSAWKWPRPRRRPTGRDRRPPPRRRSRCRGRGGA